MIKRTLIGATLLAASMTASADVPGGPNCGWGNMLFQGNNGLLFHTLASTTNGSTGNATFGMTSGTNGCSANGTLTYGGNPWIDISAIMDELSEDVAKGDGDALNAVAVSMGVQQEDRAHFAAVMHQNFATIFPDANVTSEQVMSSMVDVMKSDTRLNKYVS